MQISVSSVLTFFRRMDANNYFFIRLDATTQMQFR